MINSFYIHELKKENSAFFLMFAVSVATFGIFKKERKSL